MKYVFALLVWFCIDNIKAQTDPYFMQFNQAMLFYNPAYSGLYGEVQFGIVQNQLRPTLRDYDNNDNIGPRTAGFAFGMPVKISKKAKHLKTMGLNMAYINDKIAYQSTDIFQLGLNLKFSLKNNFILSAGAEIMPMKRAFDFTKLHAQSTLDPSFPIGLVNNRSYGINGGLCLSKKEFHHFNSGISFRHILRESFVYRTLTNNLWISNPTRVYINAGLTFDNPFGWKDLQFAPSFMLRSVVSGKRITDPDFNMQTAFIFYKILEITPCLILGTSGTKHAGATIALYPLQPIKKQGKELPQLRIGYSIFRFGNVFLSETAYTHELNINLLFQIKGK